MFQCFEVKTEDDKPSSGVFASSGEQEFLVLFMSVHSMQSAILFQQFCPSACPHVTSSDVKFHDFFFALKYFVKYFKNYTTENIGHNTPSTNKHIGRYTVLVVFNRFYYSASQKSL